MLIALTRALSPRIAEAELTYLDREPIDFAKAKAQHDAYERCLEKQRCKIVRVDAAPDNPDGVFVEDAAIVLNHVAVITRPGAVSRQSEISSVARALEPFRPLLSIVAPGTVDGGDVLRIGRKLYVGRSKRTNEEGIAQLAALVEPYAVVPVDFHGCLHLKSAVTQLDTHTLLFNPDWLEPLPGFGMIPIDPAEPFAANVLCIRKHILMAAEFPATKALIERRGYSVETIPTSELQKAESGVTCCSIIFSEVRRGVGGRREEG